MSNPQLLIVGGGLAGLSAGCYARANDFDVTIVEHNIQLGGVCTAWHRGPYLIDGCIHWLTGGPFQQIYEELGIVPAVPLRTLDEFVTYRHARDGWEATLSRDMKKTAECLSSLAPDDRDELNRLLKSAKHAAALIPPTDHAPELASPVDHLRDLWQLRHDVGTFVHFRKPLHAWAAEQLKTPRLREFFGRLMPPETPTLFFLLILGYLERGWLSRPVGGTARFRDALIDRYRALGGKAIVNTTVEEILVADGRARGVRLTDGTMLDADVVISTASAPETVFRLLAGRYGASAWKERMDHWKMFQPIVLASFGVAQALEGQPSTLLVDGIEPLTVGGFNNEYLYLRIYNEDSAFAPAGHTVVQAMLSTDYDWWATRGARYQQEKEVTAERVLDRIDRYLPGVKGRTQMTDLATPLTFWRSARSWRGAFEGWMPGSNALKHVPKALPGLDRFYMAGQWVEPGGGVPVATMSGRHVVEVICAAMKRPFRPVTETAVRTV
jgi:phytoene dehydrogenase-like protein